MKLSKELANSVYYLHYSTFKLLRWSGQIVKWSWM